MTKRTCAANAAPLSIEDPGRRAALASAGAAAVLAAIGAPTEAASADPDAGLLALREEWNVAREAYRRDTSMGRDDAVRRLVEAEDKIMEQLCSAPARTLAGIGVKAEVSSADDFGSPELVASIMADITAFAAVHPLVRI